MTKKSAKIAKWACEKCGELYAELPYAQAPNPVDPNIREEHARCKKCGGRIFRRCRPQVIKRRKAI